MRIVEINGVDYGSTGKIMLGIQKVCLENNIDCYCFSGRYNRKAKPKNDKCFLFGSFFDYACSYLLGYFTGLESCFSFFPTLSMIHKLKKLNPDIVHLHNLHGSYINCSMLFKFIKKQDYKVVWTLHDCWSFTGRCPHFQISGCSKWKKGCFDCPYSKNDYPKAFWDRTKTLWNKKRKAFKGVNDLTIVTPSEWLASLVKESFLSDYNCLVINNGIDLSVFHKTESDFRQKYNLENKKIVLGVSFSWDYRKGLDVFINLSKVLPSEYQIVLVGTNDEVDKKLPENILSINRTQNQKELAEIYSAADIFVNPTREDNYPTVNLETIACGTPVITFCAGGSAEMITDNTGASVQIDDFDSLTIKIKELTSETDFNESNFNNQRLSFDQNQKYLEYLSVYRQQ